MLGIISLGPFVPWSWPMELNRWSFVKIGLYAITKNNQLAEIKLAVNISVAKIYRPDQAEWFIHPAGSSREFMKHL